MTDKQSCMHANQGAWMKSISHLMTRLGEWHGSGSQNWQVRNNWPCWSRKTWGMSIYYRTLISSLGFCLWVFWNHRNLETAGVLGATAELERSNITSSFPGFSREFGREIFKGLGKRFSSLVPIRSSGTRSLLLKCALSLVCSLHYMKMHEKRNFLCYFNLGEKTFAGSRAGHIFPNSGRRLLVLFWTKWI